MWRLITFFADKVERMEYISVMEFAKRHGLSERTVRNYCATGKIEGAFLTGKTWNVPADATMLKRTKSRLKAVMPLLAVLREQKAAKLKGGIYHKTQIELTYNSNHIEGSKLTHEQTRYIFETNTIGMAEEAVNVDDIVETVNHFHCIDWLIDTVEERLSERYIKQIHTLLKSGTTDSRRDWFVVGDYKRFPNEVGGHETCLPEQVHGQMKLLLDSYNQKKIKALEDIIDFHVHFERIHPFQDGNGRVGRLVMFKECLANGIVPFIIPDELKMFYYRGLREWGHINGYLTDTCFSAQDRYKAWMDYFRIEYEE